MSSHILNLLNRNWVNAYSVQGAVLGLVWIVLDLRNAPWGLYLNGYSEESKAKMKPIYPFFLEQ